MLRLFCLPVGLGRKEFSVEIAPDATVQTLKVAILKRKKYRCDPDEVVLYQAKQGGVVDGPWLTHKNEVTKIADPKQLANTRNTYLKPGLQMGAHFPLNKHIGDQVEQDVVHVLVDVIPDSSTHEASLPALGIDQESDAILQPYKEVAERLKDTAEVLELAKAIVAAYPKSPRSRSETPSPFFVLENSSGTGKTQVAFNLQATGRCDVFYIVCAKPGDTIEQPVYTPFDSRSFAFRTCVERDMTLLESGSAVEFTKRPQLHLYGFVLAALRGDSVADGRLQQRSVVIEEIDRRKQHGLKPCVFFLDEFPRVGVRPGSIHEDSNRKAREKYLRAMRNVFRSFSLPVVTSSTNGTARSLLTISERSRQGSQLAWCTVFPSLPAAVIGQDIRTPQQLINFIRHSRPLFGTTALAYVQANPYAGGNLLDYFNDMVDDLAKTFSGLKRRSVEFELGQYGLFLCSSNELIEDHINLIDGHFARLAETRAFELDLSADRHLLHNQNVWNCRCVMPLPEEDMPGVAEERVAWWFPFGVSLWRPE